jgi:hypothetical protein
MSLTYSEAKALKDAGFPQNGFGMYWYNNGWTTYPDVPEDSLYQPTLEELIEACGDRFKTLQKEYYATKEPIYFAFDRSENHTGKGSSPLQAVCNLYLALHKI